MQCCARLSRVRTSLSEAEFHHPVQRGFCRGFRRTTRGGGNCGGTKGATSVRTKPDKDVRVLREGMIDLEIGVLGKSGPESALTGFVSRLLCRSGSGCHPCFGKEKLTAERYSGFGTLSLRAGVPPTVP